MLELEEKCKRCGGTGRLPTRSEQEKGASCFECNGLKRLSPHGRELLDFIQRHRDEIKKILG